MIVSKTTKVSILFAGVISSRVNITPCVLKTLNISSYIIFK